MSRWLLKMLMVGRLHSAMVYSYWFHKLEPAQKQINSQWYRKRIAPLINKVLIPPYRWAVRVKNMGVWWYETHGPLITPWSLAGIRLPQIINTPRGEMERYRDIMRGYDPVYLGTCYGDGKGGKGKWWN